jgi:hypothetical protein
MNRIFCPHEAQVSLAARTGCWDDSTRAHTTECPHCLEIARIAEWLGAIAGAEEKYLPRAEQVWLKARMRATGAARERALRPLAIAELVVRAALTLALAGGTAWSWHVLQSLSAGLLPRHWHALQPVLLSLTALATCSLILLSIFFAPILVEE